MEKFGSFLYKVTNTNFLWVFIPEKWKLTVTQNWIHSIFIHNSETLDNPKPTNIEQINHGTFIAKEYYSVTKSKTIYMPTNWMNLKGNLLREIKPIPKVTLYHSILTASLKWQNQSDGVLVSGCHRSRLWGECDYKGAAHGCFFVLAHQFCILIVVGFTGIYICDKVS